MSCVVVAVIGYALLVLLYARSCCCSCDASYVNIENVALLLGRATLQLILETLTPRCCPAVKFSSRTLVSSKTARSLLT